jgi:hypothetical protein
MVEVEKEYERIKELFNKADEKLLELVDGAIWEAARVRVELNDLHEIIKVSGRIKIHPTNKALQKELPVSKMVEKARASYINYIAKLSSILGINANEDDDEELNDYE